MGKFFQVDIRQMKPQNKDKSLGARITGKSSIQGFGKKKIEHFFL